MPSAWTRTHWFCGATLLLAQWCCFGAEKCVPTPTGEWRCGKDVTEADAAPLPQVQQRSQPPVMLIDPRRFGEGDVIADAATPDVTAPPEEVPPEVASSQAEARPVNETAAKPPARSTPTHTSKIAPAAGGQFVVQLALASSPRGFDALLKQIGTAARTSQRRQLANGSWVLLIGSFASIDSARLAIPSVIPGAFARDLASLKFK
jgi:septal ring-binding cell division protein DamX